MSEYAQIRPLRKKQSALLIQILTVFLVLGIIFLSGCNGERIDSSPSTPEATSSPTPPPLVNGSEDTTEDLSGGDEEEEELTHDNHFAKGTWLMLRAETYLHFFEAYKVITFFGNCDVFVTDDLLSDEGDWGSWQIISKNEISVTNAKGVEETFKVKLLSDDSLRITGSDGHISEYERISYDHPYGDWVFDSGSWIYIFGVSENISFYFTGEVYATEPDTLMSWWYGPESPEHSVIGVLNTATYDQRFFRFWTQDGYLTLMDDDGDWIRLVRG